MQTLAFQKSDSSAAGLSKFSQSHNFLFVPAPVVPLASTIYVMTLSFEEMVTS